MSMNRPYGHQPQVQHLPPDLHQLPRPTYPPHPQQLQQLPSIGAPNAQYAPPEHYMNAQAQAQAQHVQPPPPPPPPPVETPQQVSSLSQDGARPLNATELSLQSRNLTPFSRSDENGRVYSLDVVQQPQRARMCGFGDKDRRPITPPPCVRLIVRDKHTGKEIDCNEIEHTMYVLNVDLWAEDAVREVNLVRHTTATPSISSTTPASYVQVDSSPVVYSNTMQGREGAYGQVQYQGQSYQVQPTVPMQQQGYQGAYGSNGSSYGPPNQYFPTGEFRPELPSNLPMAPMMGQQNGGYAPPRAYDPYPPVPAPRLSVGTGQPSGMFTRNLIGSLAASAFRLSDTDDRIGIWFILQDLSVRTEGLFRLRFSFVSVAAPTVTPTGAVINGRAPVLASAFSDVFQVYSAKKFPGVCESTPLSKCFATQGIKIPIRKEGQQGNKGGNGEEDDEY